MNSHVRATPRLSLPVRIRTAVARWSNYWRKLLPAAFVPVIVRVRVALAKRRPSNWENARRQMAFILGEEASSEELNRAASAYLERSIWRGESRWHPRLVNRQQIHGVEELRRLRAAGRGFIVNFVHLGDYEGISPSLAHAGIPNHNIATSTAFAADAPVWMQQARKVVESHPDVTIFDVAQGSGAIRELLASGHATAIATDQPGHTPIRFLGHDLMLSSGAARIAVEMNVPVVVMTTHPDPANPAGCGTFKVAEVLDPAEFESAEALLDVMVSRHEAAFRAWPEAADHPLRMQDRSLVKPPSTHRETATSHDTTRHAG